MREQSALVLIHSPLIGPTSWQPVAERLRASGRHALIPSLVGIAEAPAPQYQHAVGAVQECTASLTRPVVLAGHSGAGRLLPTLAAAVAGPVAALIFVDAFLPPSAGEVELQPAAYMDHLRARATEGVLPPWWQWFGDDALRELVEDDALRQRLQAEMPRLPLSYFEGRPQVPAGWEQWPCGYLLLAEQPYAVAAEEASARGWPVARLPDAHHLSLVSEPEKVKDCLLGLERQLAKR